MNPQKSNNDFLLWIACALTVIAASSAVVAFVAIRLETRANEVERIIKKQIKDAEKAFSALDFHDQPKPVKPKR